MMERRVNEVKWKNLFECSMRYDLWYVLFQERTVLC